jgi:hypothetical protein
VTLEEYNELSPAEHEARLRGAWSEPLQLVRPDGTARGHKVPVPAGRKEAA